MNRSRNTEVLRFAQNDEHIETAPYTNGRRISAQQPGVPVRLASVSLPPCASIICRANTSPIPVPPGLVV